MNAVELERNVCFFLFFFGFFFLPLLMLYYDYKEHRQKACK